MSYLENIEFRDIKQLELILKENQEFLDEFIDKKLNDICYHISLFFYYLSYPRKNIGFKSINTVNKITNKNIEIISKMEEKHDVTYPVISNKIVNYIFNDLYNCKNFTSINSNDIKEKIIFNYINKSNKIGIIKRIYNDIEKLSSDVFNKTNVIISEEVEDIVLKYLISCIRNIVYMKSDANNKMNIEIFEPSLKKKYTDLQIYVASIKRTYNNNFIDNQIQNITFNAFLHLIICLTDWLEIDEVSEIEINTVLNIILTSEMRDEYKEWVNDYKIKFKKLKSDKNFQDFYNMCLSQIIFIFKKYDLQIDIKSSELLLRHIYIISDKINSEIKGINNENKDIISSFTNIMKDLFSF